MAQTDYVSRGQKRNKKAPRKSPKKASMPWLRIFFSIVGVCGFVFALYLLQKSPSEPTAADQAIVTDNAINESVNSSSGDVEKVNTFPDKDPLPVLGEEEWAFIDALPVYSVKIDTPEVEDTKRQYIMQCGSFRTTDRAQELRAQIALQGLEAQMLQSDGQNGRWYRIVLGPYERKRMAERDRHQLRRANINSCKIY